MFCNRQKKPLQFEGTLIIEKSFADIWWRKRRSLCQSCTQHYSSKQSISLFLFLTLPHSFFHSVFMSPLRTYSSITNGSSNDVCQPSLSFSHTLHTHIHPLYLSSCSVLACRSQSPVRQIVINWLLVDVSVTHLQTVLNLCITPGLVRQLIQSEYMQSLWARFMIWLE